MIEIKDGNTTHVFANASDAAIWLAGKASQARHKGDSAIALTHIFDAKFASMHKRLSVLEDCCPAELANRVSTLEDSIASLRGNAPPPATAFDFGQGPVPAHRHVNPDGTAGGWVADTARVDATAYVGHDARVYGAAWVFGDARVYEGEHK